jgi:hypothetical protein
VADIPERARRYRDLITERQADYTFALGQFVQAWADMEAELYRVLIHYAGLKDAAARAIFSGTRASGMVSYLYSILHNTEISDARANDLEFVLPQISTINTLRDHTVHYSLGSVITSDKDGNRIITNKSRVARYGKEFVEVVGPHTFKEAIDDLHLIYNHLNQHWHQKEPFRPWVTPGETKSTWRYRPPQPQNSNPKRERTPRK